MTSLPSIGRRRAFGGTVKRVLLTQEGIVLALAVAALVAFSIALPGFLSPGNLISLVRSVSILGMLALGMGLVVIGRGIDVSMIATMVVAVSWAFVIAQAGLPFGIGLLIGALLVVAVGLAIGFLIAFCDVPAIFTTLAMGSVVYGLGRTFFIKLDMQNVPPGQAWFDLIGRGSILGIPLAIVAFGVLSMAIHVLLTRTRFGWLLRAMGTNPAAARITGLPVRPMIFAQYVASGLTAYLAGLVMASSASAINARLYNSTMIYDVLLVVVLGGIGLSGGQGGVRNVMLGTILVGTLLNGMTIMNIDFTMQNLIKGTVLLLAIVIDAFVNPRDEQTGQQGDI